MPLSSDRGYGATPSAGIRHPWNTQFEWTTVTRDPQPFTRDEVARFTAAASRVDRRYLVIQYLVRMAIIFLFAGMWRWIDGGQRYLLGEIPEGAPDAFMMEGSVAIYDERPASAAIPEDYVPLNN